MNDVTLIGRLTADPESKAVGNDNTKTTFTIAVDRDNGKDEVDFLDIVTWQKVAVNCAKFLAKGSLVAVKGSIQKRNYEKDGKKVYVTEIVASKVKFLNKVDKKEEVSSSEYF